MAVLLHAKVRYDEPFFMHHFQRKHVCFLFIFYFLSFSPIYCQSFVISGKVVDAETKMPLANATIHLHQPDADILSNSDGTFYANVSHSYTSLDFTSAGYEDLHLITQPDSTTNLLAEMQRKEETLARVVVTADKRDKEPGKRFMKKVIENKAKNNPDRFKSYSYRQYQRHELDLSNIQKMKDYGKSLSALVIKVYKNSSKSDSDKNSLPLYFSEVISNNYHSLNPNIDDANIIAKKTLGLETDKLLWHFDKFNFNFNIYDNKLPIFSQTYVSPLSNSAFDYYDFYFDDSTVTDGKKVYQIHFTPKRKYENAFYGNLWINDSTYSIKAIKMSLSKTANLDFVEQIHFTADYRMVPDSATGKSEYMPYSYQSVVEFESGLSLLGIPLKTDSRKVRLVASNSTVIGNIRINSIAPDDAALKKMKKEQKALTDQPESFWRQNRLDSLSSHEKSIYIMVDSLQKNPQFKRTSKIISIAGTGYWDLNNKIRLGPYSSFLSTDSIEGGRFRAGIWTLPGFNRKWGLNGYIAFGTIDQQLKGGLGIKYIWNEAKWTKTSLVASSDYDYLVDEEGELDEDNLVNSFFRKNISTTRIYLKQLQLLHEQYISRKFTATGALTYKEINPVFGFAYHPLNKGTGQPIDSIWLKKLPEAEASIGLRYTKNEKNVVFNYNQIHLLTYAPILTANFSYGVRFTQNMFNYQKISLGIEQRFRFLPKTLFYYNVRVGKTFGTVPYLLLNIPTGNEYYVSSKYMFNTMTPYEFATDEYISLFSRIYLGGFLFDKIPYLRALGWRQRISFNAYQGSMSAANRAYNAGALFSVPRYEPFMEAGVGIENIFHVFSIDYYKRLSGVNKQKAATGGIYLGVNLTF